MEASNSRNIVSFKVLNCNLKKRFWLAVSLIFSWVIVAFGQPARSATLSIMAAFFGYALFWVGLNLFRQARVRLTVSFIWFLSTAAVHLSWMSATRFQGLYFYGVYAFVVCATALQFVVINLLIKANEPPSIKKCACIAALWTLFEWSRLFFICGFPFNPVGLTLSSNLIFIQSASIAGVYGMSFIVFFSNLLIYRATFDLRNKILICLFVIAVLFSYGAFHLHYHRSQLKKVRRPPLKALLVQTALLPPQKTGFGGREHMIAPINQWELIFRYLKNCQKQDLNLIALPERTVPLSHNTPYYDIEYVRSMLNFYFNEKGLEALPPLEKEQQYVNNIYLAQTVSNLFQAGVVIGLEHVEFQTKTDYRAHASAYYLTPSCPPQVYHKQILLPLVEYIPFEWCKKLAKKFGISGWYQPGNNPVIFKNYLTISPSICMEEMYSFIVQRGKKNGAQVFLNITNDGWYPRSKLPRQHFDHGRIRGVENGVSVLRACNTGWTCALNPVGELISCLGQENQKQETARGALYVELPYYHYVTIYSLFGDALIIILSSLLVIYYFIGSGYLKKFLLTKFATKFS